MADPDLSRVKRNVARMAAQNAPEADIDGYIASEGTSVAAVRDFRPSAAASQPQSSGLGMNATAGANETLYGVLGAPVDLMRGAMNLGIRGMNAATGSDVGMIPEDSFGGSRSIAQGMGAIDPRLDPQNTMAASPEERIARGVGQGVAGTVLPAGIVGGASRAGIIGERAAATGAQLFGRSGSLGAVAGDAVAGGAAGAGAAAAGEFTPEQYRAIGSMAGGLAGGGLGSLATGLPRLAAEGTRLAGRYAEPFTGAGRERMAGRQLREAASDPQAAMEAIDTAPRQMVPGSQPTMGQLTGDMGLLGLERGAQTRFPEEFGQRRADQNNARVGALNDIQPGGAPDLVSRSIRQRLQQIDDETHDALAGATQAAQGRVQGLGAGQTPDMAGEAMRGTLEAARGRAKEAERSLWSAVDPDGTLALSAGNARRQAEETMRTMPASAKPPSGEEAAVYGILGQYGDVVPFGEITALSSRLKSEMRAERLANGESPAYRRMSQLNGAIQQDLDGAVTAKVQQEAKAVAAGQMAPDQTLEARWAARAEEELAGRTEARAAGGDSGTGFVQAPRSRSTAIPGEVGAGSQARGGSGSLAGDPRLSSENLNPTFDRAAQERLTAANAATRERAQTFDNPTLGPIRRRPATNASYDMAASSVPGKIFFPQPKSFDAIRQYRGAVGDAAALETIQGYAVDRLRHVALRDDGTFDPGKLDRWRHAHADALRAFPELDARLADAGRASETMGEVAASRRQQMDAAQKSVLGRFVGVEDPQEVTRVVGSLFTRQDGARQLAQIRQTVGNDPQAVEGLRKAAADFIGSRFVSNTEVGTSGQGGIRSDQFQSFVRENRPALGTMFSEEEIGNMEAIAVDLQRSARSQNAVRIPGQSNTAQDTLALNRGDSPTSMLAKILGASATAGGGFGVVTGPVGGAIAGAGTLLGAALRENGIRTVDDLVKDALLNPDRARALMSAIRPGQEQATERTIAQRYRAAAAASAGTAASGDGDAEPSEGISVTIPSGRRPPAPAAGSIGPQTMLRPPPTQREMLAQALLAGQPNTGPAPDSRMQTMAGMLLHGDAATHSLRTTHSEASALAKASGKTKGPDGMNRMQRQFIAQRLMAS